MDISIWDKSHPLSQIPSQRQLKIWSKSGNKDPRNLDQIMNFELKEFLAQLTIDNFLAPDAPVSIEVPKLIPNQDTMLTHPTHNRLTSAQNHQILRVNQCTRCLRSNHQLYHCFATNNAFTCRYTSTHPQPNHNCTQSHNSNKSECYRVHNFNALIVTETALNQSGS